MAFLCIVARRDAVQIGLCHLSLRRHVDPLVQKYRRAAAPDAARRLVGRVTIAAKARRLKFFRNDAVLWRELFASADYDAGPHFNDETLVNGPALTSPMPSLHRFSKLVESGDLIAATSMAENAPS
jgi:hypothetical protein